MRWGNKHYTSVQKNLFKGATWYAGDRGSTVAKVLCYKSEGPWFDPSRCRWTFL